MTKRVFITILIVLIFGTISYGLSSLPRIFQGLLGLFFFLYVFLEGWVDELRGRTYNKSNKNLGGVKMRDKLSVDYAGISLSHATHRNSDLIDSFGGFLKEILEVECYEAEIRDEELRDRMKELVEQAEEYLNDFKEEELNYPEDDYFREDINCFIDELFNVLNDISPVGCTFGANEGDGADFGFWPVWDDEEVWIDILLKAVADFEKQFDVDIKTHSTNYDGEFRVTAEIEVLENTSILNCIPLDIGGYIDLDIENMHIFATLFVKADGKELAECKAIQTSYDIDDELWEDLYFEFY